MLSTFPGHGNSNRSFSLELTGRKKSRDALPPRCLGACPRGRVVRLSGRARGGRLKMSMRGKLGGGAPRQTARDSDRCRRAGLVLEARQVELPEDE